MKVIIETLKEKGMRDDYIVLVGGAPLNESIAEAIDADACCRDAAVAVKTAKACSPLDRGMFDLSVGNVEKERRVHLFAVIKSAVLEAELVVCSSSNRP